MVILNKVTLTDIPWFSALNSPPHLRSRVGERNIIVASIILTFSVINVIIEEEDRFKFPVILTPSLGPWLGTGVQTLSDLK